MGCARGVIGLSVGQPEAAQQARASFLGYVRKWVVAFEKNFKGEYLRAFGTRDLI